MDSLLRTVLCGALLLMVSLSCAGTACASTTADDPGRTLQRRQLGAIPGAVNAKEGLFQNAPRRNILFPRNFENSIGMLRIRLPNGNVGTCSGGLITTRAVLTSAHCFFDVKNGATRPFPASSVKFFPRATRASAQDLVNSPYGNPTTLNAGVAATRVRVHPDFASFISGRGLRDGFAKADLAVVLLDTDVVNPDNVFQLATSCAVRADRTGRVSNIDNVFVSGYPRDTPPGTLMETSCVVTVARDGNCNDLELRHQCSTLPGNSGGPVYREFYDEEGNVVNAVLYAVTSGAVVTTSDGVTCSITPGANGVRQEIFADPSRCYNFATEITPALYNLIANWVQAG